MSTPPIDPIEFWDQTMGPRWVERQEVLDALVGPVGELALERAGVRAGERVLDVGCGCGQTTLELARRVGPEGQVLGIDVSRPMLARARERATAARMVRIEWVHADAATHAFEPRFDLVFSRFGVMFFHDPAAAFAHLGAALAAGGRMAFVCWRAVEHNPWVRLPLLAAAQHVELQPPPPPGTPGPFSLADPDVVAKLLDAAGLVEPEIEPCGVSLALAPGAGVPGAVQLLLEVGPAASALRDVDEATRERVREALVEVARAHETPQGVVMPGSVWRVHARRAG